MDDNKKNMTKISYLYFVMVRTKTGKEFVFRLFNVGMGRPFRSNRRSREGNTTKSREVNAVDMEKYHDEWI